MPYRKNVFILGAGASASAGVPVLRDFLDRARDLQLDPTSQLSAEDRQRFGKVLQYRKRLDQARAHVEMDLDNLEDLFGLVDLQCRVGDKGALEVRTCLTFLIEKTIREAMKPDRTSVAPSDYRSFASLVSRHIPASGVQGYRPISKLKGDRDAVVTLNYDTVFESALCEWFVPGVDYALGGANPNALPVLKLHGSLNWRYCQNCEKIFIDNHEKPAEHCPNEPDHLRTPYIVPPTWDKGSQNDLIGKVWEAAHRELAEASRWIIVGYSAPPTDRFFQYLLGSAMANNERLEEVIVVNIRSTLVEEHYRGLFTRSFSERRLGFICGEFPNDNTIRQLRNRLGRD